DRAQRAAAIAGHQPRRVQPGLLVAGGLHQRQPHQRLRAVQQHMAFRDVETIGKGNILYAHLASSPGASMTRPQYRSGTLTDKALCEIPAEPYVLHLLHGRSYPAGMVGMVDWDKLRIFHAVADAGSLTHAGDVLHLSQSAVSRQVRALEEMLGSTLFHRHARGLILTEQGERLFDATKAMSRKLDTTTARIRDSEEHVAGELKITTTTGFGTLWLVPRLGKLYERYPDLKIVLMLEERVLDLLMREADVAIR